MSEVGLDSQKLAARLREKSVDHSAKCIRMTKFDDSIQATDLSYPPNCQGFGRIHRFRLNQDSNWIQNPLPILPVCKYLDMPAPEVLPAQVFQLSACDFRCWYCFVDYSLLSADKKHSAMISPTQLLMMMMDEEISAKVIDLSGGQPELVPEYVLWFLQARAELGLNASYFIWADDNLSTDYMWRYLNEDEISFMVNSPGFARVGCLKGIDRDSFSFNTRANPRCFDFQIELLGRLVNSGFDQYGYITLTTLDITDLRGKVALLLDTLQEKVHPNFPLRIVPLRIFGFNVNENRYNKQAEDNQFRVLDAWEEELALRFTHDQRSLKITDVNIRN